jgi:hypothetical protein
VKKFSLLLLDANVVIRLFELGIWDRVVEACDVHLARTVIDEADFYTDGSGQRHAIELQPYERDSRVTVHDALISQVGALIDRFGAHFLDRLHDGERESLAVLVSGLDTGVLGALAVGGQGVSLEEVLQRIGLGRTLKRQFSKAFRVECTEQGFDEGIRGFGVKQ